MQRKVISLKKDTTGAEGVNVLDHQTKSLVDRPDNTSTKKNLAALTQGFRNVSIIYFLKDIGDGEQRR